MKKVVSIGLFMLLLYHTLAYMLVSVASWWQAEHDLSEHLLVYRSVDSLVEFQIPLKDKQEISNLAQVTSDGFTYHGHYYSVVSMEVQDNLIQITGLEMENASFWQHDLLAFLEEHISATPESHQKANQFLKFLLKEYSPSPRAIFRFLVFHWREATQMPEHTCMLSARALPVHSPPPKSGL